MHHLQLCEVVRLGTRESFNVYWWRHSTDLLLYLLIIFALLLPTFRCIVSVIFTGLYRN